MPPRHLLELCVTVTDHYGYVRYLPIADPPVVAEGQHRHLLEFRYRSDGRNDFGANQNGALTLAARATSSLPVGFQPVHVGTFPDVLDGDTKSEHIRPFFRAYELADADPSWAHLVDGGVLDNKPFGPVLKAIKERPAANEVDRYLLFLEPDPKPPVRADRAAEGAAADPGAAGRAERPAAERAHPRRAPRRPGPERARRRRAGHDRGELGAIEQQVLEIVADLGDTPPLDDEKLKEANRRIHEAAIASAKLAYPIYVRLKASSAIDSFAGAACLVCDYTDASNQAFLVRAVIREWARSRKPVRARRLADRGPAASSYATSTSSTRSAGCSSCCPA